ncbi:MAG: ribonuclease III [Alphaproteobacteria bacterium]|nr:ribonuclease III [Alphaproteobacteria bacterium]
MAQDLAKLQEILGHTFADRVLLEQALRHASTTSKRTHSNERLEFLGDRVLGLAVAEALYLEFPKEEEGPLARRYAGLTSRDTLTRVAEGIGLLDFAEKQSADKETRARSRATLAADAMEAVLGAFYLDAGFETARAFIREHWRALIAEDLRPPKDAKTALQEWAQARALGLPSYEVAGRDGPDHAPQFTVRVTVPGHGAGEGRGGSRRAAEQEAAQALLTTLENES